MKRVRIDFAAPSLRRGLFQAPLLAWVLLAIGLGLGGSAAWLGQRHLLAQRALEAELAARAAPLAAPRSAPAAPPVAISKAQALAVNGAIVELNLPWGALHAALQAATPDAVALLAVEPDARRRSVRISAEARTSDAMLAYVQQLAAQHAFTSVTLTRHEINEQDPNRPLRFQIDVQWRQP